jgi:hypothetical protein
MDHAIQSMLHEATSTVSDVALERSDFQIALFGFFSLSFDLGFCALFFLKFSQGPELLQRLAFPLISTGAYAVSQGIHIVSSGNLGDSRLFSVWWTIVAASNSRSHLQECRIETVAVFSKRSSQVFSVELRERLLHDHITEKHQHYRAQTCGIAGSSL